MERLTRLSQGLVWWEEHGHQSVRRRRRMSTLPWRLKCLLLKEPNNQEEMKQGKRFLYQRLSLYKLILVSERQRLQAETLTFSFKKEDALTHVVAWVWRTQPCLHLYLNENGTRAQRLCENLHFQLVRFWNVAFLVICDWDAVNHCDRSLFSCRSSIPLSPSSCPPTSLQLLKHPILFP